MVITPIRLQNISASSSRARLCATWIKHATKRRALRLGLIAHHRRIHHLRLASEVGNLRLPDPLKPPGGVPQRVDPRHVRDLLAEVGPRRLAATRFFVLPNERGRVLTPDGTTLPGVYAVGWIKRGPTGILGTNKRDAEETINCLVHDLRSGALPPPPSHDRLRLDTLLANRQPDLVTVEGWRAIDVQETERGRVGQRPRVKLTSHQELLAAARDGAQAVAARKSA